MGWGWGAGWIGQAGGWMPWPDGNLRRSVDESTLVNAGGEHGVVVGISQGGGEVNVMPETEKEDAFGDFADGLARLLI